MTNDLPALLSSVKENPWQFLSVEDTGAIFGFGKNTMAALIKAGAPLVARKMNPDIFKSWLKENAESIGKLTA